jgi:hypothetical protein
MDAWFFLLGGGAYFNSPIFRPFFLCDYLFSSFEVFGQFLATCFSALDVFFWWCGFLFLMRYVAWIVWAMIRVRAKPKAPRTFPRIVSPVMSEAM